MARWRLLLSLVALGLTSCKGCYTTRTEGCAQGSQDAAGRVSVRYVRGQVLPGGPPAQLEVRLAAVPEERVTLRLQEPSRARAEPDVLTWEAGDTQLTRLIDVTPLPTDTAPTTFTVGFEPTESELADGGAELARFQCVALDVITVSYLDRRCGNLVLDPGETCDEPAGWTACDGGTCASCSPACELTTVAQPRCGDGVRNQPGEQCDGELIRPGSSGEPTTSCRDFNWAGGPASCSASCQYDFSKCVAQGQCPQGFPNCTQVPEVRAEREGFCVLDDDGGLKCQASGALAAVPRGPFTQLAFAVDYGCALDGAGVVRCWGAADAGETTPPPGTTPWAKVAVGLRHTCFLDTAGAVRCVGGRSPGFSSVPAGPFVDVASGTHFSCGVQVDGGGACWGFSLERADEVPPGGPYARVLANGERSCWVKANGGVDCVGRPHRWLDAQQTRPAPDLPALVAGTLGLTQLTMGPMGLCGLTPAGDVFCASDERDPRPTAALRVTRLSGTCALDPTGAVQCFARPRAQPVPTGTFVDVSLGSAANSDSACGLRGDAGVDCSEGRVAGAWKRLSRGGARCWVKSDDKLDCAVGGTLPPDVRFVRGWRASTHACGLRPDESVACWGTTSSGALTVPPESFLDVATATDVSCGVLVDGTLRCWGTSMHGSHLPPSGTFTALAAGAEHFCALATAGDVQCWGRNHLGQATPPAGTGWVGITATTSSATCAWKPDGSWECWGDPQARTNPPLRFVYLFGATDLLAAKDEAGQWSLLGPRFPTLDGRRVSPLWDLQFEGLVGEGLFVAARAGDVVHVFGGSPFTWLRDFETSTTAPYDVDPNGPHCLSFADGVALCRPSGANPPLSPLKSVSTSHASACGVTVDGGALTCWGTMNFRQHPGNPNPPYARVVVSRSNGCAVRELDSSLLCWGDDTHGLRTNRPTGAFVNVSFSEDGTSACALKPDAGVTCWGQNNALVRQGFAPAAPYRAIALGRRHGAAIQASGDLFLFGDPQATAPLTNAPFFPDWREIASGDDFTCGLTATGHLKCWGRLVVDTTQ